MSPPPPASTIGESVETTLASIKATSASLSATMKQSAKTAQTAEQTLADLRSTLARWDAAKKRFSDALDSAARRLCESLGEAIELPNGPPAGVTAHGWQHAERQDWSAPAMVTECSAIARPDMTMANTEIAAHEYCDSPAVLRSKVRALAEMIRSARRPVVYTGAGISTAAGVPDYATKAGSKSVACPSPDKLVEGADPFQAGAAIYCQPTYSHRAIVSLYRQGHVHEWVQQNHDGCVAIVEGVKLVPRPVPEESRPTAARTAYVHTVPPIVTHPSSTAPPSAVWRNGRVCRRRRSTRSTASGSTRPILWCQ